MGAAVSLIKPAIAIVAAVTGLFSAIRGGTVARNPVMAAIEEHAKTDTPAAIAQAEAAKQEAERQAADARTMVADAQRIAANAEKAASDALAAQQSLEATLKQMQDAAAKNAEEAAAGRAAVEAANKAHGEAIKKIEDQMKEKAEKDAEKVKEAQDAAEKAALAQAEAENNQQAAQDKANAALMEATEARAKQAEAKELAERAAKAADEAIAAKDKAEAGIQPIKWPTAGEFAAAKKEYRYTEGIFHYAIAGVAGSGKSSLINAMRGLPNNDRRAAKTGIVETTAKVTRYPDPDPKNKFAWYDVPGAGTLDIPDWQYFNDQGLYVFDCIIVLFDNRFTATDVAILKNCQRYNIPSYIVRSKSNQHIDNVIKDMGSGVEEDDEDVEYKRKRYAELYPEARRMFIKATRQSVKSNLAKAELPEQRVYIVSKDAMLAIVKSKVPRNFIDEYDLLKDMMEESVSRRVLPPN